MIPETVITTKLKSLKSESSYAWVTKSIDNVFTLVRGNRISSSYTCKVNPSDIGDNSKYSFPTLIQKKIEISHELRVFKFDDLILAAALFYDYGDKWIDHRVNSIKPRIVPYKLSKDVILKIEKLFELHGYATGSADLLVSIEGSVLFLEINPVGQFSNISYFCNFYTERKIILKLCQK